MKFTVFFFKHSTQFLLQTHLPFSYQHTSRTYQQAIIYSQKVCCVSSAGSKECFHPLISPEEILPQSKCSCFAFPTLQGGRECREADPLPVQTALLCWLHQEEEKMLHLTPSHLLPPALEAQEITSPPHLERSFPLHQRCLLRNHCPADSQGVLVQRKLNRPMNWDQSVY